MMLFRPPPKFQGLPVEAFRAFAPEDREERRLAIIAGFHPALHFLAEDLLAALRPLAAAPLHAHLPRLDWPQGYQPFCTWLALSRASHGYQSGPQLNAGVHRDYVALRLGWDTRSPSFGRFEFVCRHGGVGDAMVELAVRLGLRFRVYASAPWPEGSRRTFEADSDWKGAFDEVRRRGVWFELGTRHAFPEESAFIASPALGDEAVDVFTALLPIYERLAGHGE